MGNIWNRIKEFVGESIKKQRQANNLHFMNCTKTNFINVSVNKKGELNIKKIEIHTDNCLQMYNYKISNNCKISTCYIRQ